MVKEKVVKNASNCVIEDLSEIDYIDLIECINTKISSLLRKMVIMDDISIEYDVRSLIETEYKLVGHIGKLLQQKREVRFKK